MESGSTHNGSNYKLKSFKICSISAFVIYLSLFNFTGKALGNGNVKKPGLGKLVSAAGKRWLDLVVYSATFVHFTKGKNKDLHLDLTLLLLLLHHFRYENNLFTMSIFL